MKKQGPNRKFAQQFSEDSQNYSHQDNQENDDGYPIQLIQIKKTGEIKINQEAIQIIESADMPVGFVSLVGKMRTGKSYLMNKILNLTNVNGFKVDPSTASCTKGIWMWSKPYQNTIHNNLIFFLDTQGTDSLQKNVENDTKIFTLAVLISSYFIYNSVGNIDQVSLSELEMITELSKQIKTGEEGQSKGENYQLHQHMPKFLWLLRDFTLMIQDNRGRKISSTQYLQNCLNESSGGNGGRGVQKSNRIKKSIMNFFIERQCLTMVRPVNDQQDLQNINKLPQYKVRKEFIEGVNSLKAMIMQKAGPKTYQNQPITGFGMRSMIESYVEAFNAGKVPNIKSAWQQIDDSQGQNAYNKALQKLEQLIADYTGNNQPKGQQIHEVMAQIKEESVKQFQQHSFNNKNQKYFNKLKQILKQTQKDCLAENSLLNEQRNVELLTKLSQNLKVKIENKHYTSKNVGELQKDIDEITQKYNQQAKGDKKTGPLSEFVMEIMPLVLEIKEDKTEQIQKMRMAELKAKEQQQKIRRLQQQNESKNKQLQSKDNANQMMKNKANKVSRKDAQKDKSESGCCSGGKCEIM